MMLQRGIYMWEPNMSPHKVPFAEAIARAFPAFGCTYLYQNEISVARKEQGWEVELDDSVKYIHAPDESAIREIVAASDPDAIHLFSGIRWVRLLEQGLGEVMRQDRRFGIMSEPRSRLGIKGGLRYLHSWATEGVIRRKCGFVLGIGSNGPRWFSGVGYRRQTVFPFAYYSLREQEVPALWADVKVPTISFLGRLERIKGFHLFQEAIPRMAQIGRVRIAGTGSLKESLAGSAQRAECLGPLRMRDVAGFLAETDILVLPSISDDDGWGAVIAEALQAGVYVIASSRAGASICLKDPRRGAILRRLTSDEIVRQVHAAIETGVLSPEGRRLRSMWANTTLTGAAGVRWLSQIVEHVYYGAAQPASPFDT